MRIPHNIRAIDMHIHPGSQEALDYGGEYLASAHRYFGKEHAPISMAETAKLYRENQMMAVLLATDAESNTGLPAVSNDFVGRMVKEYPDVFLGFCSVDPWRGKWAIAEVERSVLELGLRGVKFMQIMQGFEPNDMRFYPLYAKCAELGVPVLFHMGTTGMGAGSPGGCGLRLKYGRPLPVDDVAADFPNLTIICAHPAWPWVDEMLAIAVHKTNVYIDLSGWAPKYFPTQLVRYVNAYLGDRTLFGTDYPLITADRWVTEAQEIGFKPHLMERIMLKNSLKVLKLQQEPAPDGNQ